MGSLRQLALTLWLSEPVGSALASPPLRRALGLAHRGVERAARRAYAREWEPRAWSNRQLRAVAPLFDGRVVNVSGWEDRDKRGGRYRDYFTRAAGYELTNYRGARAESPPGVVSHSLDLAAAEAPPALRGRYQVVLSHTTLEHLLDVQGAIRLLAALTTDSVLLVVPMLAKLHASASYGDFWRFTPDALIELCRGQGLEPVQLRTNDNPLFEVYIFGWFSRQPQRWAAQRRLEVRGGHARWGGSEDYEPFFRARYDPKR